MKSKVALIEDVFVKRFPSLWAMKYKTIKGKPTCYTSKTNPFKHRPWQQAILDDAHPNIAIEKSRQLGLSECGLTSVLHFLINHDAVKAMYIFPRAQQMNDFCKSRIDPVLQDPYFASKLDKNVNSMNAKKFLNSYLFMRSGWGSALGEGADLDYLSMDEYDRLKEYIELAFQEGLKSSKYGYMRRWSTPTTPSFGINGVYQKSDQMRYIHTCPHCGEKQFLTAEANIIQVKDGVNNVTQEIEPGTFIIGCKKCKRELDRMSVGEWVAQRPSIRDIRGYHISQMDAAWISADDIMKRKFSYGSRQLFYNYVIGEPYANVGLIVNEADVKKSIRVKAPLLNRTRDYTGIVAGIDWGSPSWMVILGIKPSGHIDLLNLFWVNEDMTQPLRDATEFCAILRSYSPNIIIADAGYGADKNSFMYTQFPTNFFSCQWHTSKDVHAKSKFIDTWNERAREVTVDKTVKMQRVLHLVKNGLIGMFPWDEKLAIFAQHVGNVRILDEEEDGIIYQKAVRVGADHTACCLAYALIGADRLTNYNVIFNNSTKAEFI